MSEEDLHIEMDQFATHIQMLIKYLMVCDGDVIELGSGNYSTPLIHEVVKSRGRKLDTYDSNEQWLERFRNLEDESTRLHHVKDWDSFSVDKKYGLAFIDHADPPSHQRWTQVVKLIPFSSLIIIHDTEDDQYGYKNLDDVSGLELIEEDERHSARTKVFKTNV
jgi:predicted O-methyltransferase YrrM